MSLKFLQVLRAEALTPFVPDYLFKHVCIVNSLGKQRWLPPEQRTGMLAEKIQMLKAQLFSRSTTQGVCRYDLALFAMPLGIGDSETGLTKY